MGLECYSFDRSYTKTLDILTKKTRVQRVEGMAKVVQTHSKRIDFFYGEGGLDFMANHNKCSEFFPLVVLAANILLAMPATACAAECNWSKFGLLFAANRNALGLFVASSLIFVQQNDSVAGESRKHARGTGDDADVFVG